MYQTYVNSDEIDERMLVADSTFDDDLLVVVDGGVDATSSDDDDDDGCVGLTNAIVGVCRLSSARRNDARVTMPLNIAPLFSTFQCFVVERLSQNNNRAHF
jgi:hypothetical protein